MDEDTVKLFIKNYKLFISLYEMNTAEQKVENVTRCLDGGADINARDANNIQNTPLHIAVQRGEKEIVQLLINRGAVLNQRNSEGKSPLDIAENLIENRSEILQLLTTASPTHKEPARIGVVEDVKYLAGNQNAKSSKEKKEFMYTKRAGTSGVCGQLYETKLLSLVLLRALNDNKIEKFALGTNINGIGDLDDICMRYQINEYQNPIMMFVQAKHREDREKNRLSVEDVCSDKGDFSLLKYFDSYLKIKEKFMADNEDDMFKGGFENVECNFILYTPVKDNFNRKRSAENQLIYNLDDLLQTQRGGKKFQYQYDEDDVEKLTKMTVKYRIQKLAPKFLNFIMTEGDKSMTDELIKRYHVVLVREVLHVLDIKSKKPSVHTREVPTTSNFTDTDTSNKETKPLAYHTVKFRPQIFTTHSEFLVCLRENIYKEMSRTCYDKNDMKTEEDVKNLTKSLYGMLENPCATTISKVISKIVIFNIKSGKLEFINNIKLKGDLLGHVKERFEKINMIDENIIREAIKIKLQSKEYKVPISFGNLDMTVRDIKRLDKLADEIAAKLTASSETDTFEINDKIVGPGAGQLKQSFLNVNGGIGGAVGNVLILDTTTKTMKFDTLSTQPANAREFLKKMSERMSQHKLERCRIKINFNDFPKYSFDGDEYDKRQAREFLNKLWFYTNQAKEDEVESILKNEINKYYNNVKESNKFLFRIHTDAIYLRSHDEIQKWWMKPGKAPYLNKSNHFFEKAKNEVIDSPLLTVLNFMYINKARKFDVEFDEVAINALEINKFKKGVLNIVTEASVLSGIKIMQYYENCNGYTFIDLDYVLSLPLNDYNTMIGELERTEIQTLIIIYEKRKYYEGLCNKLKQILKISTVNRVVIVTDKILAEQIKDYIGDKYQAVNDIHLYLIDLKEDSQNKVLKESRLVFQGEEIPSLTILDKISRGFIRNEMLYNLLVGEKLEVGHALLDPIYKDVKDCYVDRYLTREDTYKVETLNDIRDQIVVISATSGMGKSSLLSHLSVNMKRIDPIPWVVRINLTDHEKEFLRWQEEEIAIEHITTVIFLSKLAMKNEIAVDLLLSENNKKIFLKNAENITNPVVMFELELFIYMYNEGKVIFLFDDFNAICPHYEKEVLKVLKVLEANGKRTWVTTCSYRHTRLTLEREFGTPYTLEPLDTKGQKKFLSRFFKTNLRLEKLNYDQFENLYSFLKYISNKLCLTKEPNREFVPILSLLFHFVYIAAVDFFKSEINYISPSIFNEKLKEEFDIDFNQYTAVDSILGRNPDDEELELAGTPLHIYMVANYFKCRLEDCFEFVLDHNECKKKWELIMNISTLYKTFIEDEMTRFLNEDSRDSCHDYGTTKKEFLNKHKKLGLFTICKENDLTKLLKEDEITEIKDTIKKIESGEVKSCFINCVVNDVPRFGHLIFAEYFAMEFLTDSLKQLEHDAARNPLKNASLWHLIMNILLFKASPGIRRHFNYKLQSDSTLAELTNTEMCKKIIFEMLLKENRAISNEAGISRDTPLTDVVKDRLFNIANLFLSTAQCNLNTGNIDEFLDLVKKSYSAVSKDVSRFSREYESVLEGLWRSVRELDGVGAGRIIGSGALTEVPLRHAADYCSSAAVGALTRRAADTARQLPPALHTIQEIMHRDLPRAVLTALETHARTYLDDLVQRLSEDHDDG